MATLRQQLTLRRGRQLQELLDGPELALEDAEDSLPAPDAAPAPAAPAPENRAPVAAPSPWVHFGGVFARDEMQPRNAPWAATMWRVLQSAPMRLAVAVAVVIALFAFDFTVVFLDKSVDDATDAILFLAFLFLLLEVAACCAASRNYLFSFFFWLDLVGTLSILADVTFVVGDRDRDSMSEQDLSGDRPVHITRVVRSPAVLRFARVFRALRFSRLARLFQPPSHGPSATPQLPSRVGERLVEILSRQVVVLILVLVLLVPLLIVDSGAAGDGEALGLSILVDTSAANASITASNVRVYTSFVGERLLRLVLRGNVYVQQSRDISALRSWEMSSFTVSSGDVILGEALVSARSDVYRQASLNLVFVVLVLLAFASATIVLMRDARVFVAAPVGRLISAVRKLAGTVCQLSRETRARGPTEPAAPGAAAEDERLEAEAVDALLARVAASLAFGATANGAPSMVSPRPGNVAAASKESAPNELATLEAVLADSAALDSFRAFVTVDLSLENLLFWQAAERFRSSIERSARRIYNEYVSEDAPNRVAIDPTHARVIAASVDNGPWIGTFESAQWEVYEQLQAAFARYLASPFPQELRARRAPNSE